MNYYDIIQNIRVNDLNRETGSIKSQSYSNETSIRGLQDQVDYLSMVCIAMGEMFEQLGFDKEQIAAKIEEVDLRDGIKDDKFIPTIFCPDCERKLAPRRTFCMYCGCQMKK